MIYDERFYPMIDLNFGKVFPPPTDIAAVEFWCKYKYDQHPCKEPGLSF
jgi:hypothetical protein